MVEVVVSKWLKEKPEAMHYKTFETTREQSVKRLTSSVDPKQAYIANEFSLNVLKL